MHRHARRSRHWSKPPLGFRRSLQANRALNPNCPGRRCPRSTPKLQTLPRRTKSRKRTPRLWELREQRGLRGLRELRGLRRLWRGHPRGQAQHLHCYPPPRTEKARTGVRPRQDSGYVCLGGLPTSSTKSAGGVVWVVYKYCKSTNISTNISANASANHTRLNSRGVEEYGYSTLPPSRDPRW